jgi:hypothetical protein
MPDEPYEHAVTSVSELTDRLSCVGVPGFAQLLEFEDGSAWPRRPEEVLMAYASELGMDVRLLWLHAFVLWLEHEPVLDKESQEQVRAALKRLQIS